MCNTTKPQGPENAPSAQTFDSVAELLKVIEPGMRLCTSDFTGWADVLEVHDDGILGKRDNDEAIVKIPAETLLDLRGGHCIRIDHVRATIDNQGWESA